MILDLLTNAARYHPLHPRLAPAFTWLAAQDWAAVADGRLALDGDHLFAIVESGTTAHAATRRFESHRRYLDIQYVIAGGERMGWCPAVALPPGEQAGEDIWFHPEPPAAATLAVTPGMFAIFAPLEAHRPCCTLADTPAPFRKCVIKLAWI